MSLVRDTVEYIVAVKRVCRTVVHSIKTLSSHATLLVLFLVLTSHHAEGCWRRNSPPMMSCTLAPQPTTTEIPETRKNCTDEEVVQAGCINGVCFAVELASKGRKTACQCDDKYTGLHCETKVADPEIWPITSGFQRTTLLPLLIVLLVVLIVIVVIIVSVICVRQRKRRRRASSHHSNPSSLNKTHDSSNPDVNQNNRLLAKNRSYEDAMNNQV